MILAALLLAVAPVPVDGPTALESAAICRALARSDDPDFLESLMEEVDYSDAEKAQLRRECVIYLTGKRDAYGEVRQDLLTRPGRADDKRPHGSRETATERRQPRPR